MTFKNHKTCGMSKSIQKNYLFQYTIPYLFPLVFPKSLLCAALGMDSGLQIERMTIFKYFNGV